MLLGSTKLFSADFKNCPLVILVIWVAEVKGNLRVALKKKMMESVITFLIQYLSLCMRIR